MAEGKKITASDVIEDDIFKGTRDSGEKALVVLDQLEKGFKEILFINEKIIQQGSKNLNSPEGIKKTNEAIDKSTRAREGLLNVEREREKLENKLKSLRKDDIQDNEELKILISEQAKINKQLAREKLGLVSLYEKESIRLNKLRKDYKDLVLVQGANSKEARNLKKEIVSLDTSLKKLDEDVGQHQRNIGNYGSALDNIPGSLGNITSNVKNLSVQLIRLLANPIVATIVAIVGAITLLGKAFASTDTGANTFAAIMEKLNAVVDVLFQRLAIVAEGIIDIFSGDFTAGLDKIRHAFDGITDQLNKATDAVDVYIKALDRLEDKETAFTNTIAENRNKIAKLDFDAANVSLSIKARRKALEESIRLSKEESDRQVEFAKERFDIEVKNQAARIGVREATLKRFIQLDGDAAEQAAKIDAEVNKIREFNKGETEKMLEELNEKVIDANTKFFEEEKKANARLENLKEDEFQLLVKARERRNKLIKEQTARELAEEQLRFDQELRNAKKQNENLELVEQVHKQNVEKINKDSFERAQDEANKKSDDLAKLEEERLKKQLKKEEDAREAIQKRRILVTKDNSKERMEAEIKNIEEIRDFELLNTQLTEDQRFNIIKEAELKIAKLRDDFRKTEIKKQINQGKQILNAFDDARDKRVQEDKKELDEEIDRRQENIKRQQELAEKGQANQLAFEIQKKKEAELQKAALEKREQKRKEAIQIAEAYLAAYIAELEQPGSNPSTAAFKALKDVFLAKAIGQGLAGAFKDGVENFQGEGTKTSDSNLVRISRHESVLTGDATLSNPGLATAINKGRLNEWIFQRYGLENYLMHDAMPAKMSDSDITNLMIAKSMRDVKKAIEDKPTPNFEFTKAGDFIREEIRKGIKEITTYKGKRL